ncbi:ferric iron reductase [Acuticoccus sp. M5D2P5]|uniref:ferric iron reductase n=1 Tax=Acuticoccus kalidii TaxID=2910977 RepID=UPI001F3E9E1C|nr:ferric iron reductase [Acuticoccus kalidii]MCF3934007.1 ferric iron reductase [Acuticoccus kalidii]
MTVADCNDANSAAHPLAVTFAAMAAHFERPRLEVGPAAEGFRTAAETFEDRPFLERALGIVGGPKPPDRMGRAAYLILSYASQVSIASVVPVLVAGRLPDLCPTRTRLRIGRREIERGGRTVVVDDLAFRFDGAYWTDREDDHPDAHKVASQAGLLDRMRIEIEDHFAPLIASLNDMTRLSPSAMWRLVADSVAATFLEAGRRLGEEARACDAALAVLKTPQSPLANKELHYLTVSVSDPSDAARVLASRTVRSRGGCCRFYTAEDGELCTLCVLKKPDEQRRAIETKLRQSLGLDPPAHP